VGIRPAAEAWLSRMDEVRLSSLSDTARRIRIRVTAMQQQMVQKTMNRH
jgi:hypothetical protein